ncbi:MAG: efflux RND transporter periplasmic adaptor subunit [Pseudomonadota bacterium]
MSDTEKSRRPFVIRVFTGLVSTSLTLLVVAGAGAAVFLGANSLAERAAATEIPPGAPDIKVAVARASFEDGYAVERRFIGQVEAAATVSISFELQGRLVSLSVAEGDSVEKGDELARLDTSLILAERDRLIASRAGIEAQLKFAEAKLIRTEKLNEEGFASQEALDQALSTRDELINRMAETDAGLASVAINLEKSVLYAPFSGRVGAQSVDVGTTMAPGQTVISLIETAAPEVRVGLPLSIDQAALASVEIEIAGRVFPAQLTQFRPDVDPLTRTRTALFTIEAADTPLFGQTATLVMDVPVAARGTWLPIDALQEGSGSAWTVLIADNGTVRPALVEVIQIDGRRAYVTGTFAEGAMVIQTGAHRLVPGQAVTPIAPGS